MIITRPGQAGSGRSSGLDEARAFALVVLRDKTYQAALLIAAQERTLSPAIEKALMEYGWGKAPDRVEFGSPGAFDQMTPEQLAARARELADQLEAAAKEGPAE